MCNFPRPVRDQLADPELRAEIRRAEAVVGVSVDDPTDRRLFFGERAAARFGGDVDGLVVAEVPVDFGLGSTDVECLSVYVRYARGSCCYGGVADVDGRLN